MRFIYDMRGIHEYSLEQIKDLKQKASHIYDDLNVHYYRDREAAMHDQQRRLTLRKAFLQEIGCPAGEIMHPLYQLFNEHHFNADSGVLYLHYWAFLPCLKMLGDDAQIAKWVPLASE